jgi:hypothetical protein
MEDAERFRLLGKYRTTAMKSADLPFFIAGPPPFSSTPIVATTSQFPPTILASKAQPWFTGAAFRPVAVVVK